MNNVAMDIQVYVFWLTYVYISVGTYVGEELLGRKVDIWSALVENGKQYSKGIWPIYPSTSNIWEFCLLPSNTWYCLSFSF